MTPFGTFDPLARFIPFSCNNALCFSVFIPINNIMCFYLKMLDYTVYSKSVMKIRNSMFFFVFFRLRFQ